MSPLNGLNDDTLNTFGDTDGFIKTPDASNEDSPNAVVIVENKAPLNDPSELVAQLDQYDVTLQTTEDGLTKLHDLEDIEKLVLSTETISQSLAQDVANALPSLEEEVAPVALYTNAPTKTNLAATQNFVKRETAALASSTAQQVAEFIAQDLGKFKVLNDEFINNTLPALTAVLDKVRGEALTDLQTVPTSKAYLAYRKDTDMRQVLIDFRIAPLRSWPCPTQLLTSTPNGFPGLDVVNALDTILSTTVLSGFFARLDWAPVGIYNLATSRDVDADIVRHSYLSLLQLFASNQVGLVLETLVQKLREHVAGLPEQIVVQENGLESIRNVRMAISAQKNLLILVTELLDLMNYVQVFFTAMRAAA